MVSFCVSCDGWSSLSLCVSKYAEKKELHDHELLMMYQDLVPMVASLLPRNSSHSQTKCINTKECQMGAINTITMVACKSLV